MATAAEMLGRHLKASRVGYAELDQDGESFTVERDWTDAATPTFAGQYRMRDFGPTDRERAEGWTHGAHR